jgi:putative membrane protein
MNLIFRHNIAYDEYDNVIFLPEELMYYDDSAYFGMHFFWWCFWVIFWVSFFALLTPVPRRYWQRTIETPKDILLRRLARGDINQQEFENCRSVIDRETRQEANQSKPGKKIHPDLSLGV